MASINRVLLGESGCGTLALPDIPCEVCNGLTKCWGSKVYLVVHVSSKFYEVEWSACMNVSKRSSVRILLLYRKSNFRHQEPCVIQHDLGGPYKLYNERKKEVNNESEGKQISTLSKVLQGATS